MQSRLLKQTLLLSNSCYLLVSAIHCNYECLSYCAYYYPTEACVDSCMCPEYAVIGMYAEETRRMHALAMQADEALDIAEATAIEAPLETEDNYPYEEMELFEASVPQVETFDPVLIEDLFYAYDYVPEEETTATTTQVDVTQPFDGDVVDESQEQQKPEEDTEDTGDSTILPVVDDGSDTTPQEIEGGETEQTEGD